MVAMLDSMHCIQHHATVRFFVTAWSEVRSGTGGLLKTDFPISDDKLLVKPLEEGF